MNNQAVYLHYMICGICSRLAVPAPGPDTAQDQLEDSVDQRQDGHGHHRTKPSWILSGTSHTDCWPATATSALITETMGCGHYTFRPTRSVDTVTSLASEAGTRSWGYLSEADTRLRFLRRVRYGQLQLPRNSTWFRIFAAVVVARRSRMRRNCSPTENRCCGARIMPACSRPAPTH